MKRISYCGYYECLNNCPFIDRLGKVYEKSDWIRGTTEERTCSNPLLVIIGTQTGFIGKYVNVFNAFAIAKDGA